MYAIFFKQVKRLTLMLSSKFSKVEVIVGNLNFDNSIKAATIKYIQLNPAYPYFYFNYLCTSTKKNKKEINCM